ncbi:uncharacterized protein LOC118432942 [Folsomia candida]|uniref:uncharacterized protein LOC118432942 n=1 Tax=Folsomia candida TaxID=158441 RepID=UPI00160519DC|nr:uncharacterized protein LOC118432942 [Folsomia candida]
MMKVASPKSEMVLQVVEMVRFGVFHVGVAGWIFYVMFKNRGKYMYLRTVPTIWGMTSRLKRIRFLLSYTMLFVLLWIPFGLVASYDQIYDRTKVVLEMEENVVFANLAKFWIAVFMGYTPMLCFWIEGITRLGENFCARLFCKRGNIDRRHISIMMVRIRPSSRSEPGQQIPSGGSEFFV